MNRNHNGTSVGRSTRTLRSLSEMFSPLSGPDRPSTTGLVSRRSPRGLHDLAGRGGPAARCFEPLEDRQLLTVSILQAIGNQSLSSAGNSLVVDLANRYDNPSLTGSIYRFNTALGSFFIEMFDQAGEGRTRTTPVTVANFANYVNAGRYVNSIVHRSIPNFVLQGGGFTAQPLPDLFANISTFAQIQNEPGNTNIRGTIAMAKLGNQPNSATSQWFINLGNNAANLDNQNGGFTVFGRVIGNGMTVVDALASIPNFEFDSPFENVPLRNYTTQDYNNNVPVRTENLVSFSTIELAPELTYTVTTSNPDLMQATIVNGRLVLTPVGTGTGVVNVTFRIDSADGSFVEDNFNVTVAAPAGAGNLAVTPVRIATGATMLTLTATGTDFQNGSLTAVSFFRDSNGNFTFDAGDTLLGVDNDGNNGWSITIDPSNPTLGFGTGGSLIFARGTAGAVTGTFSAAVSINAAPVIGLLARAGRVVPTPGDNLVVNALNTFDRDGSVASVQFFRDANGNGTFEDGTDILLATDSTPNDGFALNVSTTGFPIGSDTTIFARAVDNEGRFSSVVSTVIRVNALPVIGTFTGSGMTLVRGQSFVLSASNVTDTDSGTAGNRIDRVDFFRDTNGNGVFDQQTDQILANVSTQVGGVYTFTLTATATRALPAGDLIFFAVPLDRDLGFGAAVSITVTVNNTNPTLGSMTATPAVVPSLGGNVTLTAIGAADADGTVSRVQFFRDSNNNGVFDDGVDTLLGEDTTPANGFSLSVNTGNVAFGFTPGTNRYFARAVDSDGGTSNVVTITNRINAAPTIDAVTVNPNPLGRNASYTLTAVNPADDGSILRVEFYRDTNGNGLLDVGIDVLLGSDALAAGGYTFTGFATNFPANVTFFARVIDNDNGASAPVSVSAAVENARPTVTTLTASPNPLTIIGAPLTLTATGFADPDGTVQQMRFYRDADGNGIFDPMTDIEVGLDASSAGGFTVTINTIGGAFGIVTGPNTFFAVAIDNEGATSLVAASATIRVNAPPTVGGLSGPASVGRLQQFTLTATSVADASEPGFTGTITAVRFYRDSNNNGVLDLLTDQLLGLGVRQGTSNTWTFTGSTAGFAFGDNTFFVRAQDNNSGFSDITPSATTIVNVTNVNPTVASVTATPAIVPMLGSTLTITAAGAADPDGTVSNLSMWFYRDANGNNTYDQGVDTLIGFDNTPANGFSIQVNTGDMALGFTTGVNRIFAVAMDADMGMSSGATTTTVRINAGPVVAGLTASSPVARGGMITLTATGVVDQADSAPAGTITTVQFFRDSNGNGTFEFGTDQLLGTGVRQGTSSTYVLTRSTAGFATGTNTFFVRATDNNQGVSTIDGDSTATATITNANPTITSLTVTPAIVTALGGNITLTAVGALDSDGTVASVQFFRDDGDGIFDPMTDTLLGTDVSAVGGYSLTIATTDANGFAVGTNRYFARAIDNDGGTSNAAQATNRINAAPVVGTLTTNGPVARRASITLTASNVTDTGEVAGGGQAGTITRVEFFLDSNGNGVFDPADRLLGSAATATAGNYTFTTSTVGFPINPRFFARAVDNNTGAGTTIDQVATATTTLTNNLPTVASVTATPAILPNLGATLNLSAAGAADSDGSVTSMWFYRDANDNGVYDMGVDTLLGFDDTPANGFTLQVNTGNGAFGFTTGVNRIFAVATDNDMGMSSGATTTTVRINAGPVVAGLTASSPVARGGMITLTATGVVDQADSAPAGTITTVQFFRDSNGNGTFEFGTDQLLGTGVRQGTSSTYVLTRSTAGFATGTNTFFVRATDNNQGVSTVDGDSTATATITNVNPTVASVTISPLVLPNLGGSFTITANGAADPDGTLANLSMWFYRDANGNNTYDQGVDTLIGFDNTPANGFSATINTADMALGFTTGSNTLFAVAMDADMGMSVGTAATIRINAGPVVGGLSASSPVARGGMITLTATGVVDQADSAPAGTITTVQFFRDANGNGTFEFGTDQLLGTGVRQGTSSTYVLTRSTAGFATGTNTFFVRATDNNQGVSTIDGDSTATATITNVNPTVASVTATPAIVPMLGSTLTITAAGAADPDGTVSNLSMWFYRDANGNNTYDQGVDTLIGFDNTPANGFSIQVNTGDMALGFTTGVNRIFAVAMDADMGMSSGATTTTVRINAVPTIAGLASNLSTVARGASVILTASGVIDQADSVAAGTITTVQFYRDVNGNGTIEPLIDRLLGTGVRQTGTNDFRLTAATTGFATGTNTILVRATDNNQGVSAASSTTITVTNVDPLLTSTSVPATIAFLGQNITITAVGARDTDGSVASVLFFRETTGDNTLDPMADQLIGEDVNPAGGFSLTIATLAATGFTVGSNRVYACVIDNDGGNFALGANFVITASNAAPVIGALANNGPTLRNNNVTLTASNLSDADGNNTVTSVEFFRDLNGNGTLEPNIDQLLGTAAVVGGTATLSTTTRAYPTGDTTILARARDARAGYGVAVATTVSVTNRAPTITSLTASPATVATLGGNLTLTAIGAADADGLIASVQFWHDVDDNGILDTNIDVMVAEDTSPAGGYSAVINTGNPAFMISEGTRRFFARVIDNDGGAAVAQATARINAVPLIDSFDLTTSLPILRTGTFTLEIVATDDLNVTSIQIFRDAAPFDNTFTNADVLLGTAVRVGTSNTWVFTRAGSVLPVGTYQLFARAMDASGAFSAVSSVAVAVI